MQQYMQQEAHHMVNNAYMSKQVKDSVGSCWPSFAAPAEVDVPSDIAYLQYDM